MLTLLTLSVNIHFAWSGPWCSQSLSWEHPLWGISIPWNGCQPITGQNAPSFPLFRDIFRLTKHILRDGKKLENMENLTATWEEHTKRNRLTWAQDQSGHLGAMRQQHYLLHHAAQFKIQCPYLFSCIIYKLVIH